MLDRNAFQNTGSAVVKTNLADFLAVMRTGFVEIFNYRASLEGLGPINNDEDIFALHNSHNEIWRQAWSVLGRMPELYGLAGHPEILDAVRGTGIESPVLTQPPFIRADMTSDEERQGLALHQDYPSGLGSDNSVTVWIPFQEIDTSIGALKVAPGSHSDHSILPFEQLPELYPEGALRDVPMSVGEILIFNQFLVHGSGYNESPRIRFSAQIRYADLACADYSRRGYPFNFNLRPVKQMNTGIEGRDQKEKQPS